jgi:predicted esterase YcpF (UPF0227 family)
MSKVLFLHGMESKPGGTKAAAVAADGKEVLNPALPKDSFAKSIEIAQGLVDTENPGTVVGSSRGGAVAMALDLKGAELVLIAPAWRRFGVAPYVPVNTTIMHCETDDIVPFLDSEELAKLNEVELITCGEDHRMSDAGALSTLSNIVK